MTKRTDKDESGRGEGKPSPLVDTRVICCGDNLVQLKRLPDACIDLIYIDCPNGAADCSHGWSDEAAQPPDAEPVETVVN